MISDATIEAIKDVLDGGHGGVLRMQASKEGVIEEFVGTLEYLTRSGYNGVVKINFAEKIIKFDIGGLIVFERVVPSHFDSLQDHLNGHDIESLPAYDDEFQHQIHSYESIVCFSDWIPLEKDLV